MRSTCYRLTIFLISESNLLGSTAISKASIILSSDHIFCLASFSMYFLKVYLGWVQTDFVLRKVLSY